MNDPRRVEFELELDLELYEKAKAAGFLEHMTIEEFVVLCASDTAKAFFV